MKASKKSAPRAPEFDAAFRLHRELFYSGLCVKVAQRGEELFLATTYATRARAERDVWRTHDAWVIAVVKLLQAAAS